MKNKALYYVLIAVFGLSGCGSDHNEAGTPPPNNPPVVNPPPAEQPPAEDPSNEPPPSEEPPPEEPPIEQPPVQEPPVEEPPSEEPPMEEPPTEEPIPGGPADALTLDSEIAADGVTPNGNIVLYSDRPLDVESVVTSVQLRDTRTTETVPAEVVYEPEIQKITITPERILDEGENYLVHVGGTRDTEGNSIGLGGRKTVRAKHLIYYRSTNYSNDGGTSSIIDYSPIPGNPLEGRRVWYVDSGEDQNWSTYEDNGISDYHHIIRTLNGDELKLVYSGPGENGIWFDSDDNFDRAYRDRANQNGQIIESMLTEDAGEDGELFTGDDEYTTVLFSTYDEEGKLVRSVLIGGLHPGEDGEWLTGDDPVFRYTRHQYDANGRLEYSFDMNNKGADGEWFTEDDEFSRYERFAYNESGERIATYHMNGPGLNGQWFDEDDDRGDMVRIRWEGSTKFREVLHPSFDGLHGTDDDRLDEYSLWTFDEQGRETAHGSFDHAGDDFLWHTDDDGLESFLTVSSYTENMNGQIEQHTYVLSDNGPDGLRYTGDETIFGLYVNGYNDTSQVSYRHSYLNPGPNMQWNDDDDVPWSRFEYISIEE